MPTRSLGSTGPTVSAVALGCMGMSGMYGAADEATSIATIHAAIDAGITLLDTGDFYGMGHNERLVGRAIAGRRDAVQLSVKFGALRGPDHSWLGVDGRPAAVKTFCAYSLDRLGVDHLDVYRIARVDPNVPIEETVGAIADLVKAGYVRHIGLSEVGADTVRRAAAEHPIVDVQLEFGLASRRQEATVFPTLAELGIGVTAYGVLSRGLLTGSTPGRGDYRAALPRFRGDNLAQNQALAASLAARAADRGVAPAQLAIAWALARHPYVVALVGARTPAQLADLVAAASLTLSDEELSLLEAAVPADAIAGSRYDPAQMRMLDSER
ncbi:MAG: aldo/keto reductase [Alphaproteobacteria bacterium]|nr:aldo/keto reductase [Alphaproteobacteria bacterium]